MKTVCILIIIVLLSYNAVAQPCNSTAEVNNLTSTCPKKAQGSSAVTAEQVKNLTTLFSTIIEPCIKNTKGLGGTWNPIGSSGKTTPEKLMKSEISIYLASLGCNKEHKVYSKHESGLVIKVAVNELKSIGEPSVFETEKNNQTIYVSNEINGSQIYRLYERTESEKYEGLAFYRKTEDAKYFLITKDNVPFFIPVTIKQALEINKKNSLSFIEIGNKKAAATKLLSKEEWIKKEGIKPAEGIFTVKQAQELNDAGYTGYSEGTKQLIAGQNLTSNLYEKHVAVIDEFLKTASSKTLAQPVTGGAFSYYSDLEDLKTQLRINDGNPTDSYVIINPAYLNSKVSKAAPQFVCVELRRQTNDDVTLKAFKNFEDKLDLEKLEQLLAK